MSKKLVIVSGHPDRNSLAEANVKALETAAKKQDIDVKIFYAYDFPLLQTNPAKGDIPAEFEAPVEAMLEANYFAFVTPMWNFGVTGGLKNFIDGVVQRKKFFEFTPERKPKGLLKTEKGLVVWTSGGPDWIYGTVMKNVLFGELKSILKFCGVKKMSQLSLGNVLGKETHQEKAAINAFLAKLENYKF